MTTPAQDGSHRRSATRAPVERPIKLQFDDSMDVIEGLCRNVSIGGMFISFDDARPAGSLVRFELELEDQSAIRGLGEVVWMKSKSEFGGPESGFGLKFRFLEQRDRQMIFKLVSQHIKERLSKRDPEVGETETAAKPEPESPSPEALGIAVPPSPPAAPEASASPASAPLTSAPVWSEPQTEPPTAAELPFELSGDAPPHVAPQHPERPSTGLPSTEPVLPALEGFSAAELELPDPVSRPPSPVFDSIDLDPSVGETPMYELGLEPKPGTPELAAPGPESIGPPESFGAPAVGEPIGLGGGAPDTDPYDHVQDTAFAAAVPWPKRHASLLLVIAVALATAAAAAYLYRDALGAKLGMEPVAVASRPVASPPETPSPEASSPGASSLEGEAASSPPTPDGSTGAEPAEREVVPPPPSTSPAPEPAPAAVPPPPVVAPPPPPVAAPPPPEPPPPAPATSGAAFTRLVDIAWSEVTGGIKIILTTNGAIPTGRYSYFRLADGAPREVVKLSGANQGFAKSQIAIGGPGVERIRIGFHRGSEIHVVLDLAGRQWAVSEIATVGSRLEVTVTEP